jgi:hypothetical protein
MHSSDILKKLDDLYEKEEKLKEVLARAYKELEQVQEDIEMCELSYMYAKNREDRKYGNTR